jgi:hypothetical protein
VPYRRPVLRALAAATVIAVAMAGGVVGRPSPARADDPAVCAAFCDGRDPTDAAGDRAADASELHGRRFVVHVSDADAMAWASVEAGRPGDEAWLDRSFDAGRSWTGRLGDAAVPDGAENARTALFNVDDPARRRVGVLRACGRTADTGDIACTAWARVSADRRAAAATGLMMFYDPATGLFDTTGWWNSANALTAIIDTIRASGSDTYRYAISTTYDKQLAAKGGQFRNEFVDDTGWWGLTWVAAYDLTNDSRYLTTARAAADHMFRYWDTRCGGGVYWKTDKLVKNAITNSLYIHLNAALSRRTPGDTTYRQRAQAGWTWFSSVGLINSSSLVNDGVNLGTCRNNGDVAWTYNQGALINALVELNGLTGDSASLATARRVADAATTSSRLNAGGITREPCEVGDCGGDGPSFKGPFVRGLAALNTATGGAYSTYLRRQADSAYGKDRNSIDQYGLKWAGPYDGSDAARQHSAVHLMNAA